MNRNLIMSVCHSEEIDTEDLLTDLLTQADEQLNGRSADACILLASIDLDHRMILKGIRKKWSNVKLIGGTTDGELSSELGFLEDSAVLIIFTSLSQQTAFGIGIGRIRDGDVAGACRDAVSLATKDLNGDPGLCLTICGSQDLDNSLLMTGLEDHLPDGIPVFGGVPGDQWRFKKLYQFGNETVYDDAVPILLLNDEINYAYGIDSGWRAFGIPGRVTHSTDNVVYTINDRPAKEYYESTLGMSLEDSFSPSEFPLIILDEEETVQFQRAPVGFLRDGSGGMRFFGTIPEDSKVTIAEANREAIIAGTGHSINQAINKIADPGLIAGALIISCSGRRLILGTKAGEEQKIIKDALGPYVPFGGLYGYGEFAPPQRSQLRSGLHNQTIVSLIFLSE